MEDTIINIALANFDFQRILDLILKRLIRHYTSRKDILSLCATPKLACPPLVGLGVIDRFSYKFMLFKICQSTIALYYFDFT